MDEISRRRTFAIISHPDAGKTTLTEKLLLYGGAIQLAGAVTARKNRRATASDWMELEKKRGISISSTVLQFDHAGYKINLLDTPGHKDFSEDTYRVLTAVDAVVMVIDAAKGIESQTRKLFELCRQRKIPIFTFMNKLDRPSKDPLELIDELERVLGLHPFPMNWPMGSGVDFQGVYDRMEKRVHLFERTVGGAYRAPEDVRGLDDPLIDERLNAVDRAKFREDVEMLDAIGASFQPEAVLAGDVTPVFFGSAMNNFGVGMLLDGFLAHSAAPRGRASKGVLVPPDQSAFSAFIFKIQGNMDPRHRDRVAFLRVCSGTFARDMDVHHARTGKTVRLSNSHKLFGRDREILDAAYPGDIVGLIGQPDFKIGDTLTEDPAIVYNEIPRFPPECFTFLNNPNTAKFKAFRKGLEQLLQEGIVQAFALKNAALNMPLLAAVGPLQFEVVQYRLETEYDVPTRLEPASWTLVQWLDDATPEEKRKSLSLPMGCQEGQDAQGRPVIFFPNDWSYRFFLERNPGVTLHPLPPEPVAASA